MKVDNVNRIDKTVTYIALKVTMLGSQWTSSEPQEAG